MLVLSRKANEGIHIGNDIHIQVIRVGARQVRLGIEAPKDVIILRDELLQTEGVEFELVESTDEDTPTMPTNAPVEAHVPCTDSPEPMSV